MPSAKGLALHLSRASKPWAFWTGHDSASVTATARTNKTLGTITATGSEDFATKVNWCTLNDSTYYTFASYSTTDLMTLFTLGEGVMLWWASVNMNSSATGQNHLLAIGAGAGEHMRFSISKATSWRPDVWIAFAGDSSATQYAGGSNEFASSTDTNVALVVDNRPGYKGLFRYVNGVNVDGVTWASKGTCNPANAPTKRIRIGADAAGSPGSTFYGAWRRMGLVNYGASMPDRINDIVQELHANNSALGLLLARSLL